LLLQRAVDAGARFEPCVSVRAPLVEERGIVTGVRAGTNGQTRELRARVTIAADGRHSTLHLRSAWRGIRSVRVAGRSAPTMTASTISATSGEMHIRRGRYIGVAPIPGGLANACVVLPEGADLRGVRDPAALLAQKSPPTRVLRERFADARVLRPPVVLGPLAVDTIDRAVDGVLLAGDAAGSSIR
jgi:flavin-dependent dehydrogenase